MLGIENSGAPTPKCYFTHALLGENVDEKHPPTKKKPFSTILAQPFSHTAHVILPESIYEVIKHELHGAAGTFHYARVIMSLGDIIDGQFFNHYIKTGNVLMLSEGRRGIDNVFSLYEGTLRLELDRATYERCGLEGKPIPHSGRKHTKERYAVELDLRKPSMLHGKKGFERIVWAFKNVLTHSLTWLFHDLQSPADQPPSGPLVAPTHVSVRPEVARLRDVKIPPLTQTTLADLCDEDDDGYGLAVLEWFGMVSLGSPRIDAADDVDAFLSRYEVPVPYRTDGEAEEPRAGGVVRLQWRGLVPARWLLGVWMVVRKAVVAAEARGKKEAWMALSVAGFAGETYTMLGIGGRDVVSWECR